MILRRSGFDTKLIIRTGGGGGNPHKYQSLAISNYWLFCVSDRKDRVGVVMVNSCSFKEARTGS